MNEESNLVGDQLDLVKRNIYRYWIYASDLRAKIHKQKVEVPDQESFTWENDFKAAVLELYYACEPKFGYYEEEDFIKQIRLLEPIEPGSKFTLSVAEALLRLLTIFAEKNGITKYEEEKYISKPS